MLSSFEDPFKSIAMRYYPSSMYKTFELTEWMYHYNGIYRAAIERAANLFMTDFIYDMPEDIAHKDIIKDFLEKNGRIKEAICCAGIEQLNYGNSFLALYLPFKRHLVCLSCGTTAPIESVADAMYESTGEFSGFCSVCHKNSKFKHKDISDKTAERINIMRINPKYISPVYNPYSGNAEYIWDIKEEERYKIKNGKGSILIHESPIEILDACIHNKNISFNRGELLHIKQTSLSESDSGWGMPFGLSCFPLIFYISILRKANEAISMDYIIPLRILYPQNATQFGEASLLNAGTLVAKIKQIINNHKIDPLAWHTAPAPLGYQVIGGEKRSLMITDDIKISNDELLNSMGFPAELFYGTLSLQSTPMALRLLENTFRLSSAYNKILEWMMKKVCRHLGVQQIKVSVSPLRWMDDMEKRNFLLQAASADKISEITLLELYGLDWETEQRKKIKQKQLLIKLENESMDKLQREVQMQQNQEQGGGAAALTPQAKAEQAMARAQQLISMPYEQRRPILLDMLKSDKILHDLTIAALNDLRQNARSQ